MSRIESFGRIFCLFSQYDGRHLVSFDFVMINKLIKNITRQMHTETICFYFFFRKNNRIGRFYVFSELDQIKNQMLCIIE